MSGVSGKALVPQKPVAFPQLGVWQHWGELRNEEWSWGKKTWIETAAGREEGGEWFNALTFPFHPGPGSSCTPGPRSDTAAVSEEDGGVSTACEEDAGCAEELAVVLESLLRLWKVSFCDFKSLVTTCGLSDVTLRCLRSTYLGRKRF